MGRPLTATEIILRSKQVSNEVIDDICDRIASAERRAEEAEKKVLTLLEWFKNRPGADLGTLCFYCGAVIPPERTGDHWQNCDKHPSRAALVEERTKREEAETAIAYERHVAQFAIEQREEAERKVALLVDAADEIDTFAWSAMKADCEEARVECTRRIEKVRAALRAAREGNAL